MIPAGSTSQLQAHPVYSPHAIIVSKRQQGNPVLSFIRNVRWQYGDIVPDYIVGQYAGALFLSLRYHLLHPQYLSQRLREVHRMFRLTVLVCHVDSEDPQKPLGEVARACVIGDCTLLCAWTVEECARWLETLKSYEHKPATAIQERAEHDYASRLTYALTGIRGVNRTDAATLGGAFDSLANIFRATPEELSGCPGLGPTKVRRLYDTFHEPFRKELQTPGVVPAPAIYTTTGDRRDVSSAPGSGPGAEKNPASSPLVLVAQNLYYDPDDDLDSDHDQGLT